MSSFSVALRPHPEAGAAVLELTGELDAHTAPEFEAALERALADGHTRVVINGSALQYVSSAGLGVFMAFVEPMRERGGDLKVAALQPRVYEVFDLLGFPLIFDMQDTEEAALAAFERPAGDVA